MADFDPNIFSQNFTKATFPLPKADHHRGTDKDKCEHSPLTRTVRSLASLDKATRGELTFVRAVHLSLTNL